MTSPQTPLSGRASAAGDPATIPPVAGAAGAQQPAGQGSLQITIVGTPAPQGSKRGFYNHGTGRVQMVESSKKVKPWRQDVKAAALEAQPPGWVAIEGAVQIEVAFYLGRPQGHYGSGRNSHQLKASAPLYPAVKPDLDKLLRSTLDALGEAGCWRDDSRVVAVVAHKFYADGALPGAVIHVAPCDPPAAVPATQGEGEAGTAHPATVQEALL